MKCLGFSFIQVRVQLIDILQEKRALLQSKKCQTPWKQSVKSGRNKERHENFKTWNEKLISEELSLKTRSWAVNN